MKNNHQIKTYFLNISLVFYFYRLISMFRILIHSSIYLSLLCLSLNSFAQKKDKSASDLPEAITAEEEYMMLNSWDKDGKPLVVKGNGHQIEYHENGQVKAEGEYVEGHRNGKWMLYHENGKIESEGEYKNGKPLGKWSYYSKKGKLRTEIEY